MRRHTLAAVLIALALPLLAQTGPNFSGTWVMDKEKSDPLMQRPGGGAPPPMDITLVINHTEKEMVVTRKVGERSSEAKYSMDGSENANPSPMGRGGDVKSKSKLDGSKLVITGTQKVSFQEQEFEIQSTDEYSLSADGKVLTIVTTRTTPRGDMTRKQVFNKQ